MATDLTKVSFWWLVVLFVISMFLMILRPNLISILVGWDGLGLVSYVLVIYFQTSKSYSAGIVTFLSNRIGDLLILLAISWCLVWGGFDFMGFQLISENPNVKLVSRIVLIAALTKRAQIPFSAWLPAAMAAPTPVSSLVHSSTLVTAGVYLLIRFNLVVSNSFYLLVVSLITMFLRGLRALYETDIKKVIALSTLRQLGLMMFSLSVGLKDLAFFHLVRHALFKSLIFLCAGAYIHFYVNSQEARVSFKLSKFSSLLSVYFFYGNISLMGVFFLSGFYSKDAIIERFLISKSVGLVIVMIFARVLLTVLYTLRLLNSCVALIMKAPRLVYSKAEDSMMYIPIFFLFVMSLVGSGLMAWTYFPLRANYFPFLLKIVVPRVVVASIILFAGVGGSIGWTLQPLFWGKIWVLPVLTSVNSLYLLNSISKISLSLDQGWLEILGPQGTKSFRLRLTQASDKLSFTALYLVLSLIFSFFLLILAISCLNSLVYKA